jgi:hypothetical protein
MFPIGIGKRACFTSSGRSNTDPGEKSTLRSMQFCNSGILPGQSCLVDEFP